MDTSRRVFKNTLFLYTAEIIYIAFGFIQTIVIARKLGSFTFGQYSFATSILAIFMVFADLGIITYFIKEGSRKQKNISKLLGLTFFTKFILSLLTVCAIILYSFKAIPDFETQRITLILSLSILIGVIPAVIAALFRTMEKMKYEAIIKIITSVISSSTIIIAIYSGFKLQAIAIILLAMALIPAVLFTFIWRKKYRIMPSFHFTFITVWKFLKAEFPFFVLVVMNTICFRINIVMIAYIKDTTSVGMYNAAFKLMEGLLFVPWIFSGVILPVISKKLATESQQIKQSMLLTFKFLIIIALPIAVGITLFSGTIISIVYGEAYAAAIPVLRILGPLFFVLSLTSVTSTLINASPKPQINTYIGIMMLTVNVCLAYTLLKSFNIWVGAISTLVVESLALIIGSIYIYQKIISVNYTPYLFKPAIATGGMALLIIFTEKLFLLPIYIIFYFLILLIIKGVSKQDILFLKKLVFIKGNWHAK